MEGWGKALLIIFGILWGVPVVMLFLSLIFAILKWTNTVSWHWGWIAIPLTIAAAFIAFDEKYGLL